MVKQLSTDNVLAIIESVSTMAVLMPKEPKHVQSAMEEYYSQLQQLLEEAAPKESDNGK